MLLVTDSVAKLVKLRHCSDFKQPLPWCSFRHFRILILCRLGRSSYLLPSLLSRTIESSHPHQKHTPVSLSLYAMGIPNALMVEMWGFEPQSCTHSFQRNNNNKMYTVTLTEIGFRCYRQSGCSIHILLLIPFILIQISI